MQGSQDTMEVWPLDCWWAERGREGSTETRTKNTALLNISPLSDHMSNRGSNWSTTIWSWRRNSSPRRYCPVLQGKRWSGWKVGWRWSIPWSWTNIFLVRLTNIFCLKSPEYPPSWLMPGVPQLSHYLSLVLNFQKYCSLLKKLDVETKVGSTSMMSQVLPRLDSELDGVALICSLRSRSESQKWQNSSKTAYR